MDVPHLYLQAQHLLGQRLTPGTDTTEIISCIHDLETIIATFRSIGHTHAHTLLLKTQHLYYQAERERLNPKTSTRIRNGLDTIAHVLADTLQTLQAHPQRTQQVLIQTRTLAQQHKLAHINSTYHEFEHIPYICAPVSTELLRYLHTDNIQTRPEQFYHILPLHATMQHTWNLEAIGIPDAWKYSAGEGVRIGVVDSGCSTTHAELIHACAHGYNFVDRSTDTTDQTGHGTHVAGTIAGLDVGVAPNACIHPLKIFDQYGLATETGFLEAAEWAINNNLDILNASFGSTQPTQAEHSVCQALRKHNITIVAAAGNAGTTQYSYPASYPEVISVAAINRHKRHASFSQRNTQLTISAPGVSVYSCIPGGYAHYDGTSMAAPHVSGAIALLHSQHPHLDFTQQIQYTAEHLGKPSVYGAGLIRADRLTQ